MSESAVGKIYNAIRANRTQLSNQQYFPNIIAPKEEFPRSEVHKEILNMAIIEDALKAKPLNRLQFQHVLLHDVVARVSRFRACIFGMKKSQKVPFGLQHGLQALHQRFDQRFG